MFAKVKWGALRIGSGIWYYQLADCYGWSILRQALHSLVGSVAGGSVANWCLPMYLLNAYLFRLESLRNPVLKSGGTDPHRFEHALRASLLSLDDFSMFSSQDLSYKLSCIDSSLLHSNAISLSAHSLPNSSSVWSLVGVSDITSQVTNPDFGTHSQSAVVTLFIQLGQPIA